jgi:hypothetical protein
MNDKVVIALAVLFFVAPVAISVISSGRFTAVAPVTTPVTPPRPAPAPQPAKPKVTIKDVYERTDKPCKAAVEGLAQYDLRWTGRTSKSYGFPQYRLTKGGSATDDLEGADSIHLVGDRAEAQNGFGNWMRVNYSCTYDLRAGKVVDATLDAGRR